MSIVINNENQLIKKPIDKSAVKFKMATRIKQIKSG